MLLLLVSLAVASPVLTAAGDCPGPVTFTIDGLEPGGSFAIVAGSGPGAAPVRGGRCAGVDTGVAGPLEWVGPIPDLDADGRVVLTPTLPGGICGAWMSVVELGDCGVASAIPVSAACEVVWYDGFEDGAVGDPVGGDWSCDGPCEDAVYADAVVHTGARSVHSPHRLSRSEPLLGEDVVVQAWFHDPDPGFAGGNELLVLHAGGFALGAVGWDAGCPDDYCAFLGDGAAMYTDRLPIVPRSAGWHRLEARLVDGVLTGCVDGVCALPLALPALPHTLNFSDDSDDPAFQGHWDDVSLCTHGAAPVDADGDGFVAPEDCDDADPSVYPGAPEDWSDAIDQDCNGRAELFEDDFESGGIGDRVESDPDWDCCGTECNSVYSADQAHSGVRSVELTSHQAEVGLSLPLMADGYHVEFWGWFRDSAANQTGRAGDLCRGTTVTRDVGLYSTCPVGEFCVLEGSTLIQSFGAPFVASTWVHFRLDVSPDGLGGAEVVACVDDLCGEPLPVDVMLPVFFFEGFGGVPATGFVDDVVVWVDPL